ncbi:MAG: hypothetical protein KAH84_08555 [Thiomargarita sp.]|nr:hypothetical protein [Thiomargarita sp.]
MKNNSSIKRFVNLSRKLTEIRLRISNTRGQSKVFIILEGNTDIKLFRSLFSLRYTDTTSIQGKDNVEEALIILAKEGYIKFFGIVDADFSHLEKGYKDIPNIFLTDHHDGEVMMINSPALNSVVCELSSEKCLEILVENIKSNIFECASYIGYSRWFHEKESKLTEKYILKFDGLDFNKFITVKKCQIFLDKNKFLDTIIEYSKPENLTANDLSNKIENLKQKPKDYLQICNGHDLTKLLSLILFGNINPKKIESHLRVAFNIDYFKLTNLYKNIMEWSNKNNYLIFDE